MTTVGPGAAWRAALLQGWYLVVVALLFLPLALVALMSVSASPFVGFPIEGLTLDHYDAALADPDTREALALSLGIMLAATALALAVGTWIALAASSLPGRIWPVALAAVACLPLVTPGIVSAIALRMYIRVLGIDPGPVAVALGHAVQAVPYVVLVVGARLRGMPPELAEASQDLGAGPLRSFVLVTLPWLAPALLGATLLAALLSFEDFLRAFFLGDWRPTLPVLIFARLNSGMTPEINAVATIVLALAGAVGLLGERQLRRAR